MARQATEQVERERKKEEKKNHEILRKLSVYDKMDGHNRNLHRARTYIHKNELRISIKLMNKKNIIHISRSRSNNFFRVFVKTNRYGFKNRKNHRNTMAKQRFNIPTF